MTDKRGDIVWPLILTAVVVLLFVTGAPTDTAFSSAGFAPACPERRVPFWISRATIRCTIPRAMPTTIMPSIRHSPSCFIRRFLCAAGCLLCAFRRSQTAAIAAECVCYAALAIGSYRLARFWLARFLLSARP